MKEVTVAVGVRDEAASPEVSGKVAVSTTVEMMVGLSSEYGEDMATLLAMGSATVLLYPIPPSLAPP